MTDEEREREKQRNMARLVFRHMTDAELAEGHVRDLVARYGHTEGFKTFIDGMNLKLKLAAFLSRESIGDAIKRAKQ